MNDDYLSRAEAEDLAANYLANESVVTSTQEILDSGVIPALKGFVARPGKVSDSIFGGWYEYLDKANDEMIEFENPSLYAKNDVPLRAMVRTPEISTHDQQRGGIPFKDQILALNHNYMRKLASRFIGTSQFEVDGLEDSSVVIAAENLDQFMFENVLRAFMADTTTTTSLINAWRKGKKKFCGHDIESIRDQLFTNGPLPYIMDTPSTKSDVSDESVSPHTLFRRNICTPAEYRTIINGSIAAFGAVSQYLLSKGILFADTKTEHGRNKRGEIVSQDELFTMDSSRFWLEDEYNEQFEKLQNGEIAKLAPVHYSKEFAREFAEGKKGFTDDQKVKIAARYIEGIQHLLGERFIPDMRGRDERVVAGLEKVVSEIIIP
ncbi:phosphoribosylaminoimidazolesuccinocarboxamide synthase [Candidatus Woesearchaeota archaeon]|nr:phosphoribosylaminoimidazolesuccinocarboxamide synthase [Candidatus Woesearchaeota archaeon]